MIISLFLVQREVILTNLEVLKSKQELLYDQTNVIHSWASCKCLFQSGGGSKLLKSFFSLSNLTMSKTYSEWKSNCKTRLLLWIKNPLMKYASFRPIRKFLIYTTAQLGRKSQIAHLHTCLLKQWVYMCRRHSGRHSGVQTS